MPDLDTGHSAPAAQAAPAADLHLSLDASFAPAEASAVLRMRDQVQERIAAGQPIPSQRYDRDYRHKDGSTVTLEVVFSGLYDETGKLEGFVGVGRDVTALRAAEQALRKANHAAISSGTRPRRL